MERSLGVERLYPLGDYKNIKFVNNLSGIPEELASNDRVVSLLFLQQALSCEIAYREYYDTIDRIAKEKIQNALGYLQEQREQTLAELYEEIEKVGKEKEAKNVE